MWESVRCVVLNSTYEPLAIVPAKRALVMYFEGKVAIKEEHPNLVVHSVSDIWAVPTTIVLHKFVAARPTFRVPARLTPTNLWKRDKYTCQYCGRHRSEFKALEKLTRDHVVPSARGGTDCWENVVASCSTCNNKKADKLLTETTLRLTRKPYTPTIFEIWSKADTRDKKK